MKPLTALDPETKSPDIVAGNIDHLKTLFPEAFAEGKLDFEVLKQLLGGTVEEREEKYGLNWHGKRRARQLALTPSTGTLLPCPEDSVDWETTRNPMIEGDNLEVLKLLQKSYAGKVRLIYIDPPYNTGKDFVYPDDFQDNIKNYLQLTGQVDGNGHKITSNTESSGRFHTDNLKVKVNGEIDGDTIKVASLKLQRSIRTKSPNGTFNDDAVLATSTAVIRFRAARRPVRTSFRYGPIACEDRCVEARAAGRRARAGFQPEGSERQDVDAPVDHGAEGRDARFLPVGGLVTLLQNATGRVAKPVDGTPGERVRVGGD